LLRCAFRFPSLLRGRLPLPAAADFGIPCGAEPPLAIRHQRTPLIAAAPAVDLICTQGRKASPGFASLCFAFALLQMQQLLNAMQHII